MEVKFNEQYDKILHEKYEKYGWRISQNLWKKENQYLVDYVNEVTPLLADPKFTFATKLFWVLHHMTDFPRCQHENCNNPLTRNITIKHGYDRYYYCSYKCMNSSSQKKQRVKDACLEKYGVENPFQSEEVKEQIKNVVRDRYGVDYYTQSEEYLESTKAHNLEKYGVEWPMQSPEYYQHYVETLSANYGVINVFQMESTKKSIKDSFLKNGYDSPMHCPEICEKVRKENYRNFYKNTLICESDYVVPLFSEDEYVNGNHDHLKWQCARCGKDFETEGIDYTFVTDSRRIHAKCPHCFPTEHNSSLAEQELYNAITSRYHGLVKQRDRTIITPKEIDISIPDHKIAIEFNGVYWHSKHETDDANYHNTKSNLANESGYDLIHVFENEWHLKKDIVCSYIFDKLGIWDKEYDASDLTIKEVDNKTASEFRDKWSLSFIEPEVNLNLGLFDHDNLVCLYGFLIDNDIATILSRCSLAYVHIDGLLKKFIEHLKSTNNNLTKVKILVDRRYDDSKLFENNGFKLVNELKPREMHVADFMSPFVETSEKFLIYDSGAYEYQLELNQ